MTQETHTKGGNWKILVVDDDPDVHAVTRLVLSKKMWRNQGFALTHAYSREEAAKVLEQDSDFHVAVVDVVMESSDSGLKLCALIRDNCPRSMRIVLRTGQAGDVPEEEILNEYDIDYYLHKMDMAAERLFSVLRACLRSSQDISTLLAYGKQLQSFTKALQHVTTADDLVVFMGEALQFLELKHNCVTIFNYDLSAGDTSVIKTENSNEHANRRKVCHEAMRLAHDSGLPLMHELQGPNIGLGAHEFAITFQAREDSQAGETGDSIRILGGIVFTMKARIITEKARRDLASDARLFIENWCIAYSALRLRERLNQEQLLRNQMYHDRLEGIAAMVTGVAHELNTPLGVARTAGSVIEDVAREILEGGDDPSDLNDARADLGESVRLMNKNLDRAHRLIQSFRKLSASQLSDECVTSDLKLIIEDCVETMLPDMKKNGIKASVESPQGVDLMWHGYPGHLSQVIINLIQNVIRYAYSANSGGKIDVCVDRLESERFRIKFSDYGRGVRGDIKPRMFDAFVTSGRETGGTGLGLAIIHNIVTNILNGSIECESREGEGTCFTIDLPVECKEEVVA